MKIKKQVQQEQKVSRSFGRRLVDKFRESKIKNHPLLKNAFTAYCLQTFHSPHQC